MGYLESGALCKHEIRLVRPLGSWGPKGLYCLICGWRLIRHGRGRWDWGDYRLDEAEVTVIRKQLKMADPEWPGIRS